MSGFGLLGAHLGHSMSPRLHRYFSDYSYELCEIAPEALGNFLNTTSLRGMNVTIPYKKAVIPFCTDLSPLAKRLGSVNTLVRRDNGWYGDNTDYAGFCYMLSRAGFSPQGKKGLVLGSGGASKTVQAALRDLGAAAVVEISRTGMDNYCNLSRYADAQFIVNATPVGMYPEPENCLVALSDFPRCEAVFDLIYNPIRTVLLTDAASRGLIAENGLAMLVAQAVGSAQLFLCDTLAPDTIEKSYIALQREMGNIVLIGMPGSGKSTVGSLIATSTGKTFYDTDEEIKNRTGRSPGEYITQYGESSFRDAESSVIADISRYTGAVIACGGGAVLREENMVRLRRNGTIIWLQRSIGELATDDRPLSVNGELTELLSVRRPLYEKYADFSAENSAAPELTAKQITERL